ncbi:ATP-binding cassette transporter snq2, partial [Basidiobolus ranarum]
IAEAMASRSAINCWDCSTRGLDAASALDYVKSLRVMRLMVNELQDLEVNCKDSDYIKFFSPTGQLCGKYAEEFLMVAPGYLADENATNICHYCSYTYGQDFTAPLCWSFDHRWANDCFLVR